MYIQNVFKKILSIFKYNFLKKIINVYYNYTL